MEQKTLSVEDRKEFGKGPSGRLRRDGKIPAVIYGRTEPVAITVDEREFERKFHNVSESTIINLKMGPKNWDVLVKDFQDNPFKGKIEHIDFYEIEKGKVLKAKVPIHTEGGAVGVRAGGILELLTHEVEIECLPKDLLESITVDVSNLDIGNSIHIKDLEISESIKILTPEDQVVVIVSQKAKEEIASEQEGEETAEAAKEEGEAEGDEA